MLSQPSEQDHCEPGEEEDPEEGFGGCVSHSLPFVQTNSCRREGRLRYVRLEQIRNGATC